MLRKDQKETIEEGRMRGIWLLIGTKEKTERGKVMRINLKNRCRLVEEARLKIKGGKGEIRKK